MRRFLKYVFHAEIWPASAYNSIVENYGCHLWFIQKLKAGERKKFAPRGWATVKEKKRGGVRAMAYVHNYWQNRGDMTQEGIDTNLTSLVSGNTLAKNQIWFGWERNTVEFIIFLVRWCSKAGEFFSEQSISQLRAWLPSLFAGVRLRFTLLWYKPRCLSNVNYFVIMLTKYWSLSQQGHLQSYSKSKAWQQSTLL